MTRFISVLGTHGWPDDPSREWWWPGDAHTAPSPLCQFLAGHGILPARPDRPMKWSGDVDGIPGSGKDWEAGAESLTYYAECLPYELRNVIAHSHGGQVALLAAADGLKLRSLIMVGTPVRKDIEKFIAPLAVRNIGRVLHITDAQWDAWGLLGGLFDFRLSFRRHFLVPGIVSEKVKGIGHAEILRDQKRFALWEQHGWLDVLRGAGAANGVSV